MKNFKAWGLYYPSTSIGDSLQARPGEASTAVWNSFAQWLPFLMEQGWS